MSLERLTDAELATLCAEHPDVPADYVSFLREFGWGDLASGVQFYSGPVCPSDVFGTRADRLPGVLLIADDFAGTSFAYIPAENWRIVSFDSLDMRTSPEAATFGEFLAKYHARSG